MTQYTSRAQLKEKARDQMAGHYGNAILLSICRSLIVFSLTFAVSMTFTMILTVRTIMGGSAETSLTEYLLLTATTTLLSIFAGVFQTGITLFYLNTACNRPAVTANLFYGFKYLFKKSLGISAVLILLNTACTLPFDICYFLLRSGKGFDTITMAILCIVLMVIGMCIYIPLALGLSQAYYLLLDFPQYNAMELMKLSFRIMKGHLLEAVPVMGCYCDVIGVRSFARFENKEDDYNEKILSQFIEHSGRPVFSMEAATRHPLQSFADLITIEEYKKTARPKVVMTWAPHPKSLPQAVPNSFAEWMNATDYEFVITHPEGYELDPRFVGNAKVEYDQKKAFEGADFIYAKNWSAYKDPNYGQVISTDRSWTVDAEKMALTNNAYFMHCLPVRRNMIGTDDVIESPQSIVIPEAANREISAQTVLKKILEGLK